MEPRPPAASCSALEVLGSSRSASRLAGHATETAPSRWRRTWRGPHPLASGDLGEQRAVVQGRRRGDAAVVRDDQGASPVSR